MQSLPLVCVTLTQHSGVSCLEGQATASCARLTRSLLIPVQLLTGVVLEQLSVCQPRVHQSTTVMPFSCRAGRLCSACGAEGAGTRHCEHSCDPANGVCQELIYGHLTAPRPCKHRRRAIRAARQCALPQQHRLPRTAGREAPACTADLGTMHEEVASHLCLALEQHTEQPLAECLSECMDQPPCR